MATTTERERQRLAEAASAALGDDAAATLMELLVPAGDHPATRRDLATHADRVDERMTAFETRMDERMTAFETRMDQRLTTSEERMDQRCERLRAELTAVFRQELVTAVSGQTRAVVVSTATAVFGIGGLAVTLSQLLG